MRGHLRSINLRLQRGSDVHHDVSELGECATVERLGQHVGDHNSSPQLWKPGGHTSAALADDLICTPSHYTSHSIKSSPRRKVTEIATIAPLWLSAGPPGLAEVSLVSLIEGVECGARSFD